MKAIFSQHGKELPFYGSIESNYFFLFTSHEFRCVIGANSIESAWYILSKEYDVETLEAAKARLGSMVKAFMDKEEKAQQLISLNLVAAKALNVEVSVVEDEPKKDLVMNDSWSDVSWR